MSIMPFSKRLINVGCKLIEVNINVIPICLHLSNATSSPFTSWLSCDMSSNKILQQILIITYLLTSLLWTVKLHNRKMYYLISSRQLKCIIRGIFWHIFVKYLNTQMLAKKGTYSMLADLCHSWFHTATPPSEKSTINKLKFRGAELKNANKRGCGAKFNFTC
jgi:hypothetical protein